MDEGTWSGGLVGGRALGDEPLWGLAPHASEHKVLLGPHSCLFLLSIGGSVTLEGRRAGVLWGPVLAVGCWVGCWGSGQIPAAGLSGLGPSCPLGLSSWDLGAYCLLVS